MLIHVIHVQRVIFTRFPRQKRKMKIFEHREAVKLLSCLLNFEKEFGFDLKEHLKNCSEFAQRLREEAPVIKKLNRDVGKKYLLFTASKQLY